MAGKPMALASPRLAYAIDGLSKNTLADMLVDIACAEIGEDASEEQIASHLQSRLDTVQRIRGDKPISLETLLRRHDHYEKVYRERSASGK